MELGIDYNGTASGYTKKPKPKEEAKPIDYSLLKLKAEEWHDNLMRPIFQKNEEERYKRKYSFYVKNLIGKNEKGDITINGKPLMKYRLIPQED